MMDRKSAGFSLTIRCILDAKNDCGQGCRGGKWGCSGARSGRWVAVVVRRFRLPHRMTSASSSSSISLAEGSGDDLYMPVLIKGCVDRMCVVKRV